MKVGIFDSGIGGLTVLNELIKKYPNNQYCYFGDTANIPYGNKDKQQLEKLANYIIKFLLTKEVDMIIIACGTVSSTIYSELINKYSIPICDVITPTIDYINKSDIGTIGLIATPATVNSKVFENNISKSIVSRQCPMFVPLIESDKVDSEEMNNALHEYLNCFKDSEALILGCTHYPILSDKINDLLPQIKLINMGIILANNLKLDNNSFPKVELYFSKIDNILTNNINHIINCEYEINEVN